MRVEASGKLRAHGAPAPAGPSALDQSLAMEVLRILNRGSGNLKSLIAEVLKLIKRAAGFDAVALRLQDGEDFPYYRQDGFSRAFLREERSLCARREDGSICRDDCGRAILECTCGLVLSGRAGPGVPCCTAGGSFWTNRSGDLPSLPAGSDPRIRPRDRCIHDGYQSMALVPVRCGEQIVGLLQLNDRRPDRFTPEQIQILETLAGHLGLALQRQQVQDALQKHQRLLDATLDNILAHVAYLDRDFNFVRVNNTYAAASGYTAEQLLGKNHFALFPNAENEAIFRRVRDTGEPYIARAKPFEYVNQPERGVTYWDWWLRPVLDPRGRVEGLVLSLVDVTTSERGRREVERLNEELRHASAAKDQFLAVLSHELRTPLTPVVMTVAALETEPDLPAYLREDLAMIRRNIELETRLIDDLLDLNRINHGKLSLRLREVRMLPLLRSVADLLSSEMRCKRLRLVWDVRSEQDRVQGDGARLQQVIWNLLKNAVKFTPEGGTLTVRTHNPATDRLAVEFHDTGIGIDPAILPAVFQAFEQGPHAMTRRFGGLGLGLAISRAIVEMHGGTIAGASDGPGKGARFTVELPLAESARPDAVPPHADAAPAAGASARRILLVEDHPDTLKIMRRLLELAGYLVWTATSVGAARALLDRHAFDLLVSDIGLPDGTGLDLVRLVRARGLSLPAIAVTGYGMEHDIRTCLEAGFFSHLTKPVNPQVLQAELERLCPVARG